MTDDMIARLANPTALAAWELAEAGAPADDMSGTQHNLAVAQALGQLRIDHDGERCTGFVAFIRLSPAQLLNVVRRQVRLFSVEDNTPGGAVCFLMEQVNVAGRAALQQRMRWLSAQPGVEVLAGWRGARLRCHRVRYGIQ